MHDIEREVKRVLRLAKGQRRAHLANMMSVAIVHLAALERAGVDPDDLLNVLKKGLLEQFPEWEAYLLDAKRLIGRIGV
ncbi:MAG TPA: hypothetical protein VFR44_04795 [Actinomycetota bacterium]|nr:hypothetical protein [Actinomycetota bacterium]